MLSCGAFSQGSNNARLLLGELGWDSGALLDKCFFHLYQIWQCWHLGLDPAACTLGFGQVFLSGGKNPQARVSSETPNVVLETLQTLKKKIPLMLCFF